jgi:hypothetical protein
MEAEVIVTYVICDDTIKFLGIKEDKQTVMSLAEVITTAIISTLLFSGNLEKARRALKSERYFPKMLSKGQLNRRLHKIEKHIWNAILENLFRELARNSIATEYIVDSFPIAACKMARKNRARVFAEKKYLGYCAAKQEFFIGLKGHMISDINGIPKELLLLPASESDISGLRKINLNLPTNSGLYADKGYNDYKFEDQLIQQKQIHLMPIRKGNSKRKGGGYLSTIRKKKRKVIETAFSCIEKLMPRSIHAVTKAGFELKATLFVLAYACSKMIF